jgi:hypothetical protein
MTSVHELDDLLATRVSMRALALLRIAAGLLALQHLRPFLDDARHGFIYRDAFYHPYASWYPELSRPLYVALLWVGAVAAIAMTLGIATRLATATTFAVVAYNLFLSTTNVHNNRAYLVIVLGVLALAPCDRELSLDRVRRRRTGHALPTDAPGWPLWLLRFEAAAVYGASGLSKLLDPDWFDGTVAHGRIVENVPDMVRHGVPHWVVSLLTNRTFDSFGGKVAIATELFLAIGLWSRRTRYAAVWVAVCFHVAIQLTSSVEVFSYLAIAALAVWSVPSTRDRVLVVDPSVASHRTVLRAVRALDWLARVDVEPRTGARISVVDRDGTAREGRAAVVFVASRLPVTAWFALPALLAPSHRGRVPRLAEGHVDTAV